MTTSRVLATAFFGFLSWPTTDAVARKPVGKSRSRTTIRISSNQRAAAIRSRIFQTQMRRQAHARTVVAQWRYLAAVRQRTARARYLNHQSAWQRRNLRFNQTRRGSIASRTQPTELVLKAAAAQKITAVQTLAILAVRDPKVPATNKRIVAFATRHLSKKVGNGSCWTLAYAAQVAAGAQLPNAYVFGREITLADSMPGDILQFTSARIEYPNGRYVLMGIPSHTAIILWRDGTRVVLLHQNFGVKSVTVLGVDMRQMTRGSVQVYRPLQKQ